MSINEGAHRFVRMLLVLIFLLLAPLVSAADASRVDVDAILDSTGTWTLEEARKRFADMDRGGNAPAVQVLPMCWRGTSWLRVTIHNAGDFRLLLNSSRIEDVRFYYPSQEGLSIGRAGAALPMHLWTWPGRVPNIPIHVSLGQPAVVFVAARTCLPVKPWVTVVPETEFIALQARAALRDGILCGALFAMALAVAAFAIALRSKQLALLAPLGLLGGLHELASRGYGLWLIWPTYGDWNVRSPHALGSALALLLGCFCWWAARGPLVAHSQERGPYVRTVALFTIQIGSVVFALYTPPDTAIRVLLPVTLVFCTCVLVGTLIQTTKRGATPAVPIMVTMMFSIFNILVRGAELGWPMAMTPGINTWLASGIPTTVSSLMTYLIILGFWVWHSVLERRAARREIAQITQLERSRLETEVQSRTAALNQALALTEHKNTELNGLLGYIGHDLRAPLATIAGYTQRLKEQFSRKRTPELDVISQNVDYQLRLIDDLVHYSRHDRAPLANTPAWISLSKLLTELSCVGLSLCASNANRFRLRLRNVPCYVKVDPTRLRQILTNLLSNAAKFTRFGEVELTVVGPQFDTRGKTTRLVFSVRDTGIGIPKSDFHRVFQAYATLNERGSGTGLGLFITAKIAEDMGAIVKVKSEVSRGTRISLITELPHSGHWISRRNTHPRFDIRPGASGTRRQSAITSQALLELIGFAEQCQYSEVLDWLGRQDSQPDPFFERVQKALRALDFQLITALARKRLLGKNLRH